MSEMGHERHFERAEATSASHPIADISLRRTKCSEGPIVLQNDFERWSEEYFSEIARQCGILIQEPAPSDSNLAHYWHGKNRTLNLTRREITAENH